MTDEPTVETPEISKAALRAYIPEEVETDGTN